MNRTARFGRTPRKTGDDRVAGMGKNSLSKAAIHREGMNVIAEAVTRPDGPAQAVAGGATRRTG
ncbi:hypothetical protein LWE61_08870 [Sphingobium sufflavum]|uniref:hypothetical protein n=1 Tax=Sphingobium sufflavum TaxID=1129547 RepID=UPI001F3B22F1|nr:hypothetical protein [Sphingobium sufflavum]MCE7796671.1 hypothetical protein [Sphingobium sufflavum]